MKEHTILTTNVDVDLVVMRGFKTHQIKYLQQIIRAESYGHICYFSILFDTF